MKIAKKFILMLGFSAFCLGAGAADLDKELASKVLFGKAEDAVILIEKGANVYAKNSAGTPVLNLAAGRHTEDAYLIINALIKGGANVYSTDAKGNMAIVQAIKTGHPYNVQALIQNKAVVSVVDAYGKSMLELAQLRNDPAILQLVTDRLNTETAELKALQTPEHMQILIKKLSFLYCSGAYFKYFYSENPGKMPATKYQSIMAQNKQDISDTSNKLFHLFNFPKKQLKDIARASIDDVTKDLDILLTRENRLYNGFGSDKDSNSRCTRVAERFKGAVVTKKKK